MADYKFKLGDTVRVTANRRDPGGVGTVTAREQKEDNRGTDILYRVRVVGHEVQERFAAEKNRENDGFWYISTLVNAQ